MSYEMLVGLNVLDDEMYQQYREAMTPILHAYGGGFNCDFRVSEVLLPETNPEINRVFTIFFRDRSAKDAFFSDPLYLKVKEQYFVRSVSRSLLLASYDTN